jgi:hypothetical protein
MQTQGVIMGEGKSVLGQTKSLADENRIVLADHAMDMLMIQRNIRDLAKTANFAHSDELEELYKMAITNLKTKMQPGQPLAEAPDLVVENFKMLSMVRLQTVEVKRKAADTLLKARVLIDPVSQESADDNSEDPFNDVPQDGAVIQEGGVFGGVVPAGDSVDDAAADLDIAL